jgi:hypothetical protein
MTDDTATDDTATKDNKMDSLWFLVPLVLLIGVGVVTILKLWSAPEPTIEKSVALVPSQLVATQNLKAFTKLTKDNLVLKPGTAGVATPSVSTVEELTDRYLLVAVIEGGEVKREMVAAREATPLLGDAVAVGIQPTSLTAIGGQLQVGDMVDVVPTVSGEAMQPIENVMVLNVVNAADKGSGIPVGITLAIPRLSSKQFAAATAAGIVVTRKIPVAN